MAKSKKRHPRKPAPRPVKVKQPERVVIGYLSGGYPTLEFTASLASTTGNMVAAAYTVEQFPQLVGALPKKSGPRIAAGRNNLVKHFLATGADWLFMVDDDMTFAPDALPALLAAADAETAPIVGGLTFGGGRDGWFPTLFYVEPDSGRLARFDVWPEDQLMPVDATGAACLLVHRRVFEKVAESYQDPWPWFQEVAHGNTPMGEDITFCLRARAAGFPIFVHTGVQFGHVKTVTVDTEFYMQWVQHHRFVVTGTGRCGTRYLAYVLSASGVTCGHEEVFTPDGPGMWAGRRGDSSWLAAPHLEGFDGYVLHLVRNPLHVVRSLVGMGFFDEALRDAHGPYVDYARSHIGGPLGDPVAEACRFVVEWNRMIEPHAHHRVQVETVTGEDLVPVARAAGGHHAALELQERIDLIPTDINARPRAEHIGWADVTDDLRTLAEEYGYTTKEP